MTNPEEIDVATRRRWVFGLAVLPLLNFAVHIPLSISLLPESMTAGMDARTAAFVSFSFVLMPLIAIGVLINILTAVRYFLSLIGIGKRHIGMGEAVVVQTGWTFLSIVSTPAFGGLQVMYAEGSRLAGFPVWGGLLFSTLLWSGALMSVGILMAPAEIAAQTNKRAGTARQR